MARNTKVKCLGHRDPKLWEEPSPQSPEVPGKSAHGTSAPTETPGAAPLPQVRPGVLTPSVCRLGPCSFQPSRCLLTAHLVEGAQRCSHPPHSPSGDNALLSSQLLDRCPVNLCGYVSTASPLPPWIPVQGTTATKATQAPHEIPLYRSSRVGPVSHRPPSPTSWLHS